MSASLLAPIDGAVDLTPQEPDRQLRAASATLAETPELVRSDFGAGTYHFTPIVVRLLDPSGSGRLTFQLAVPELDDYVWSDSVRVASDRRSEATVAYRSGLELHPSVVTRSQYRGRLTVRFERPGGSKIVVEETITIEVRS